MNRNLEMLSSRIQQIGVRVKMAWAHCSEHNIDYPASCGCPKCPYPSATYPNGIIPSGTFIGRDPWVNFAREQESWTCKYCQTINFKKKSKCGYCGAPHRK